MAMLDRRALGLVCLYGLLGFGHESVMAGVLPLVVLERGGGAAFVGLLVAAYGIPTILLRPLVGRVMDTRWRPTAVRSGAAIIGLAPLGYLFPSLPAMVVTRVVQGVGWAAYGTGGHAILARIATPTRRSEAAGYYNATPALAVLIGPTIGLWLYANVSVAGPFLLASALGLGGLLVTRWLPLAPVAPAPTADGSAPPPAPKVRLILGLFDPAAIVPMLLIGTFMSVQSLFVIFAPVFAREHDIPIEQLAIYYPIYGVVLLVAHLLLGRVSDRVGRFPAIVSGGLVAIVGLAIAAAVPDLVGLVVGGGLYGVATALISSTVSAVTMESAPPERTGSAMATYSVGYQLGASIGGAAWGTVIAVAGYPWPFVGGALMVAASLAIAVARLRGIGRAAVA
jgi:MFS family permease